MNRFRRMSFAWVLALGAVLVATRLTGNHLHLCFDGSEPPVSLHHVDGGQHDCPEGVTHDDSDVDLPGYTLAKAKTSSAGDVGIAPILVAFAPHAPSAVASHDADFAPRITDPARLRPPTRGPPA